MIKKNWGILTICFLVVGLILLIPWAISKKPTINFDKDQSINALSVPADPLANTYFVSIQNQQFTPSQLNILVGQSITFINNDSTTHQIVSDTSEFNSGQIEPGMSAEIYFSDPGTYQFHCNLQSGIKGIVSVETPQ